MQDTIDTVDQKNLVVVLLQILASQDSSMLVFGLTVLRRLLALEVWLYCASDTSKGCFLTLFRFTCGDLLRHETMASQTWFNLRFTRTKTYSCKLLR